LETKVEPTLDCADARALEVPEPKMVKNRLRAAS
jgi:hypothetical protein